MKGSVCSVGLWLVSGDLAFGMFPTSIRAFCSPWVLYGVPCCTRLPWLYKKCDWWWLPTFLLRFWYYVWLCQQRVHIRLDPNGNCGLWVSNKLLWTKMLHIHCCISVLVKGMCWVGVIPPKKKHFGTLHQVPPDYLVHPFLLMITVLKHTNEYLWLCILWVFPVNHQMCGPLSYIQENFKRV